MKCLPCNESSEKSLCDDCSNKKRCKECNKMKTDSNTNFYKYKNSKMYSTCIECFNKKVRCEFCNKELNKSYLKSHIKKQHVPQSYTQGQSYAQGYAQGYAQSYAQGLHDGDSFRGKTSQQSINIKDSFKSVDNDVLQHEAPHCSTIIVGPSFCGKTHLLLNKLQLIRLCDSEKQRKIITRSPRTYS